MNRIEHSGVVVRVDVGRVYVEIIAQGACGGCSARQACGLGESEHKIVEILTPDAATYRVGGTVTVCVTKHVGMTAVLLAYVIPFVVMVGVIVAGHLLAVAEGLTAMLGLGSVILYFGIIGLNRRKIEKKIHFTLFK